MSFFKPSSPIYVLGPSSYLPERLITNKDLIEWMGVDIRASWIEHRTGIYERRWVREDQACSDIAVGAAKRLIADYSIDKSRIAQLVMATISGDYPSPPTAPLVLPHLGLTETGVFVWAPPAQGS
jgi:3-oxoacyl-[acyl-carrier-protein] synthase-3